MTYDYEAVGPVMSMQPKDAHKLLIHSLEAAMIVIMQTNVVPSTSWFHSSYILYTLYTPSFPKHEQKTSP